MNPHQSYKYNPSTDQYVLSELNMGVAYTVVILAAILLIIYLFDAIKDIVRVSQGLQKLFREQYDVDMLMKLTGWTPSNVTRSVIMTLFAVTILGMLPFLYEEKVVTNLPDEFKNDLKKKQGL